MFDVSNLKKTSSMSVSSPNLAVPGGPVPGLFTKWGRGKKSKLATSKTHLLKSTDGLDNAGFIDDSASQVRKICWGKGFGQAYYTLMHECERYCAQIITRIKILFFYLNLCFVS